MSRASRKRPARRASVFRSRPAAAAVTPEERVERTVEQTSSQARAAYLEHEAATPGVQLIVIACELTAGVWTVQVVPLDDLGSVPIRGVCFDPEVVEDVEDVARGIIERGELPVFVHIGDHMSMRSIARTVATTVDDKRIGDVLENNARELLAMRDRQLAAGFKLTDMVGCVIDDGGEVVQLGLKRSSEIREMFPVAGVEAVAARVRAYAEEGKLPVLYQQGAHVSVLSIDVTPLVRGGDA